jgi:antitoxin PrlF
VARDVCSLLRSAQRVEDFPISFHISYMKSMKARVAERGQVTIPKRLRERLGVQPGTILEFSEEGGRLIAIKCGHGDPVSDVYGCLGRKINTDAVIRQLRGRK